MDTKLSPNAIVCEIVSTLTSHARVTAERIASCRRQLRALTSDDNATIAAAAKLALHAYDDHATHAVANLYKLPADLDGLLRASAPVVIA